MTSLFWYVNVNIGSRFTFSRGKQFTILVLEHRLKTPTRRRLHCKRCFSYPLYFANRPSICKNSGDPQTNRSLSGASIQLFCAQQSNYFWLQPHSLGVKQFPDSFCLVVTQKKTTWFYFQRGMTNVITPKNGSYQFRAPPYILHYIPFRFALSEYRLSPNRWSKTLFSRSFEDHLGVKSTMSDRPEKLPSNIPWHHDI